MLYYVNIQAVAKELKNRQKKYMINR